MTTEQGHPKTTKLCHKLSSQRVTLIMNDTLYTTAKISLDSRKHRTRWAIVHYSATTKISQYGGQNMTGWVMHIIQDFDRQLNITNTENKIITEKASHLRDPPETSTSYITAFSGSWRSQYKLNKIYMYKILYRRNNILKETVDNCHTKNFFCR